MILATTPVELRLICFTNSEGSSPVISVEIVAVPKFKGFYRFLGLKDPFVTPPQHLTFFTQKEANEFTKLQV